MYESYTPYFQAEINYRRERIMAAAASRKVRRHRLPRLGRTTVAADDAR